MSAVSKKVMPASRAAVITTRLAARSIFIPKLLHPRPTRLASSPEVPSGRFSIMRLLLLGVGFANRPRLPRSPLQFDGEECPVEAGTVGLVDPSFVWAHLCARDEDGLSCMNTDKSLF